ncbi:MAG: hypothetical protein IJL20_06030 [Lachnospiraceae bacterium]|nr:hypothetical protein [Lachnospiraceae bacterium]
MAKIRITSNPYAKLIKYARWSEETEAWQDINYNDNPDSKLISDDLTTNFFPFKLFLKIGLSTEVYHEWFC